jgi:hypothetical protein
MKVPDLFVGRRLFVGCGEPVGLGIGPTEIRGSAYIEGPMIVGNPLAYPIAEANLMVARCVNVEALPPPPSIFKVSSRGLPPTPIDVMLGDPLGHVGITINSTIISIFNDTNISIISPYTTGVGILNWVGAKTLTGVVAETGAEARAGKEAVSAPTVDNGNKVINGNLIVDGSLVCNNVSLRGTINVQAWKEFDIPHPTKSNHRLVHACIEGPEIGVYCRGKLIDNTIIELPEYWRGLVDSETITVNLTPHGCYQELFVKAIEWGTKIIIQNNSGGPINCSYVVYGKRKDVPDLEVEYEGTEMRGL